MRPTLRQQSALRTPLNAVLGTEANVRILRVVTLSTIPQSSGEIARDAKLQPSGVRRALDRLVDTGLLERVGSGRRRSVRLRSAHPLASALRALFEAERQRAERVLDAIQQQASTLSPPPRSVWVQGPVAKGLDQLADPVLVGLLADAGELDNMATELRAGLSHAGSQLDVTFELRALTQADLVATEKTQNVDLEEAQPVFGPAPYVFLPGEHRGVESVGNRPGQNGTHPDSRLLRLAAAIAQKLAHDPALVDKALMSIRRRLQKASAGERHELEEWQQLLQTMSLPRLRHFLVDTHPRAERLRQTLPFLDALSPKERESLLGETGQ